MLNVQLLGQPAIHRDGAPVAGPKGAKAWVLLAYLLLTETAPSRETLTELLVPDAADPPAALRWNLSQLRRSLGDDVTLEGDPVQLQLPEHATVDVALLTSASWSQVHELPGFGRTLLEGLRFDGSAGAELWLAMEQRRVQGRTEDLLHAAALRALARDDPDAALEHAYDLASRAPLDENAQVVLVRALRAADGVDHARKEADAIAERFRRELGVEPSPALRTAVEAPTITASPAVSAASVRAQLDAGDAAVAAGATDAGLVSLRSAVAGARTLGDAALLLRALTAVGSALVHAARGNDEEGSTALLEAEEVAHRVGDPGGAAFARRELAYVSVLRGRYDDALTWIEAARQAAGSDVRARAWIGSVEGLARTDLGQYGVAREVLEAAVEDASDAADARGEAYAQAHLGRTLMLYGEFDAATVALDRAIEQSGTLDWTGFLSWPEAFRGEIELRRGDTARASEIIEHAFSLGCSLGDPCWESLGVRGLGLVAEARGDIDHAIELLEEAPRRCRRLPDAYLWVEAYAYDALCDVATRHGVAGAARWVARMDELVSPRGMRELASNAAIYRARLGEPGAWQVARSLAEQVDNPLLAQRVEAVSAAGHAP